MPDTVGGMTIDSVLIGGFNVNVFIDGYEKGNSLQGGPWRNVVYIVDWNDSDAFMDFLMGHAPQVLTPNVLISFPQPHRYPGNRNLVCMDVSCKNGGVTKPADPGVDANGNADPSESKLFSADFGFVTARYAVPRFDVFGEANNIAFGGEAVPWSNDSIRGYTHSYPVPAGALKGKDTGAENDKALDVTLPHQEWSRNRKMFNYLFTDVLDGLVGTVNSTPIFGKAKGTMLLQPYDAKSDTFSDGNRSIDLNYSWLWRPIDWNAEIQKDAPFRWEIQNDGGTPANYRYPYMDHTILTTSSLVDESIA